MLFYDCMEVSFPKMGYPQIIQNQTILVLEPVILIYFEGPP